LLVVEHEVVDQHMRHAARAGTLQRDATNGDRHVGEALVDLVFDGAAQEVERDRPLRQPHEDGHGDNQQNGQDRHQAVSAYPSKAPQRLPVPLT